MRRRSLDASYFVDRYARDPDPWRFSSSAYEAEKYRASLAVLPPYIDRGLEVGCSIGVFTQLLARRCRHLTAIDTAPNAIEDAKRRCHGLNVDFRVMWVPTQWPAGTFDLIVLSEVLYYLTPNEIGIVSAHVREALTPKASVLLVHWLGKTDYPLSGDDAAECFMRSMRPVLNLSAQRRTPDYRLDLLVTSTLRDAASP